MIRTILIVIALVGVFLLGTWTQMLRQQNDELSRKLSDLRQELAVQKAAYDRLYDEDLKRRELIHDSKVVGQEELKSARARLEQLRLVLQALQQTSHGSA